LRVLDGPQGGDDVEDFLPGEERPAADEVVVEVMVG
jgi:hypothetical protein